MGEQLSFSDFAVPPIKPTMPRPYTKAWLALLDMIQGPITQPDWTLLKRGWRLAAAYEILKKSGIPCDSEWVHVEGCEKPIKRYFLKPEGLEIASAFMKGCFK